MAELTIEQKRLAIEKGLSQFLPESVLQRALSYWEREYGHQPSFVLNRFLSEICSNDELRMQRKEMLRQVLYEISILEKQQHLKVKDKKVSTTQPSIQINENNNALFLVFYKNLSVFFQNDFFFPFIFSNYYCVISKLLIFLPEKLCLCIFPGSGFLQ